MDGPVRPRRHDVHSSTLLYLQHACLLPHSLSHTHTRAHTYAHTHSRGPGGPISVTQCYGALQSSPTSPRQLEVTSQPQPHALARAHTHARAPPVTSRMYKNLEYRSSRGFFLPSLYPSPSTSPNVPLTPPSSPVTMSSLGPWLWGLIRVKQPRFPF